MADSLIDRVRSAFSKRAVPTETLGSSVISWGDLAGLVGEPDRRLNLLGQQRWERFDDILRDLSIVAAGTRLFLNLISNAVWSVNPPDDLNENEQAVAEGYAQQVYDEIFGMTTSWTSVVRKTAMFRMLGFSIQEWTAKRNEDGTIGLLDVEHRPQRTIARWIRDEGGTVEAVVQRIPGRNEVTLPRSKIVYAVDDVLTDSPEGVGLFRHLYATADRLLQFLELEEVGFRTDLRGIPIARAPLGELQKAVADAGPAGSDAHSQADTARRSKLQMLRDFIGKHVRNENLGMLMSSDTYSAKQADGSVTPSAVPKWTVELLNGDSQSFDAMDKAVTRMNHDLARILGVEHLLLGEGGGGSLALARSKIGTFYLTVSSTVQELVEVYDRDLIAPLAELNGWDEHLWPQMAVNEIADRDIDQVTAALKDMATAGATLMPDDPAIGEIRDMIGLSRPTEDSIAIAMDASLLANRAKAKQPTDPNDPNAPLPRNPEDKGVTKLIKSRSRRRLRRRSN